MRHLAALRRVCVIFGVLVSLAFSQTGRSTPQSWLWQRNLREFGYGNVRTKQRNKGISVTPTPYVNPSLSWIADNLLAAAFVTGDATQGQYGSWDLHILLFDTQTGELAEKTSLALAARGAGIFGAPSPSLLAYIGTQLISYSPELKTLMSVDLPSPAIHQDYRLRNHVWASPSGHTLLFMHRDRGSIMFDTASLQIKMRCTYTSIPHSINDVMAVRYAPGASGRGGSEATISASTLGKGIDGQQICGAWQPMWRGNGGSNPQFVGDHTILAASPNGLVLLTDGGHITATENTKSNLKRPWDGSTSVAAGGMRFALGRLLLAGVEIPALDIYRHTIGHEVDIYSDTLRLVWRKEFKGWKNFAFALSRDGGAIAVLTDGVLEVYQLPQS